MRISELARRVEESTGTIRYYESLGVLPEPPRNSSGYRDYGPEAISDLRLIRTLQCAGLSLADMSALFTPQHCCCQADDVTVFISKKQAQLDAHLETLVRMHAQFDSLLTTTSRTQPEVADTNR